MMDEKAYNKAVAINMRRIMYEKGISQVDLVKALGEPARDSLESILQCVRVKSYSKSFGTLHI